MRDNGTMNTRARGRKSQVLPTTTTELTYDDPGADEPKLHASGGISLRRILLSRSSSIHLYKVLIGLGVLSMGWTMASRFEISWPSFQREERVYPRYVRHLIVENRSHFERLDINMDHYPSKRTIYVSPEELEAQEHLSNGGYYRRNRAEPFETDTCKAMYDWQLKSYPTCNTMYEFDLTNLHAHSYEDEQVRLMANGYWRDVWMVREGETQEKRVLKTMRYEHDFVGRNYDRHRRDAVAMERLTSSRLVVNIFGFCGNSGLFEYADGGDISNVIWPRHNKEQTLTKLEKLEIATQAAMGLAAMHNIDKEGQASIAHTDITPGQFIMIDGIYKLNDFNRARFIRWDAAKKESCPYQVGNNPGTNRAPEEYKYLPQTEKVDVYSLGNIFYMLLTGTWPFEEISDEDKVQKTIASGKRPSFNLKIWHSEDPIDQTLKEAMMMCHEQDPEKRSSARQVETVLVKKLLELEPNALKKWGLQK